MQEFRGDDPALSQIAQILPWAGPGRYCARGAARDSDARAQARARGPAADQADRGAHRGARRGLRTALSNEYDYVKKTSLFRQTSATFWQNLANIVSQIGEMCQTLSNSTSFSDIRKVPSLANLPKNEI